MDYSRYELKGLNLSGGPIKWPVRVFIVYDCRQRDVLSVLGPSQAQRIDPANQRLEYLYVNRITEER